VHIAGLVCVLLASYWLGLQEKKKVGIIKELPKELSTEQADETNEDENIKRPKMIFINLILTVLVITALITELFPLTMSFVEVVPLPLVLNYRDVKVQQERIESHYKATLYKAPIIFCAGIFTGILTESGKIYAMANALSGTLPEK